MTIDDVGRTAVYAAEAAAFEGTDLEAVHPIESVLALVEVITTAAWWPAHVIVSARAARADARSSSARTTGCGAALGDDTATATVRPRVAVEIRVAESQATVATVAHELAHAFVGVAEGHSPRFRRAYLDLVQMCTNVPPDVAHGAARRSGPLPGATARRGALHVEQLAAAFAAFDLQVGARTWPEPPWTGAIAL